MSVGETGTGKSAALWLKITLALVGASLGACGSSNERVERPRAVVLVERADDSAPPVSVDADEVEDTIVAEPVVAEPVVAEPVVIEPVVVEPVLDLVPVVREEDSFFGREDAPIRRALTGSHIDDVERGRGGRSLGFKITLADGTRGYFKPDQTFNGMSWNAEIAAYHLDRELGLGRTAPSIGRRFAWDDLRPAAGSDYRVDEILVDEDGTVEGAFIYWVPERLETLDLPEGWERWLRIEGEPDAVTPFQRPNEYRAELARRRDGDVAPQITDVPEPDTEDRPAELSDMIVFDYLTNNVDRWSENRTNVRTIGDGGPIMFLDNAAGFTLRAPRVPMSDLRLRHVQRFRRSTIDALREFDIEEYTARLERDPLAPLLSEQHLRNLETRRQFLLAHVDALIEAHGEDAVLAW